MKYLILVLSLTICVPAIVSGQGMRGEVSKDPEYVRFEQEDVSKYRQRFDFELPVASVVVEPVEVPEYKSIENLYFQGGRKVYIEADARLNTFIKAHKKINAGIRTVPGFRIQIFAGASRDGANRVKSSFLRRYPQMSSYLVHVSPTYRVRVGDFLEKSEAERMVKQMKETFPGAFVVPDKVVLPKYKGNDYLDGNN